MAISNSKFLEIKNPFLVLLIITTPFILALNIKVVKSEDVSFNIPAFPPNDNIIFNLVGDASFSNGALQLTKKDQNGNPTQHSVGFATYSRALELNNKTSGTFADFTTEFSFLVDRGGVKSYGDGFTFFLASTDFVFPPVDQSSGGYLGLFTSETALDPSKNSPIVIVEFDSLSNAWDPEVQGSHIGYDINSIISVVTDLWLNGYEAGGTVAKARISYNSQMKSLSVVVRYPDHNGNVAFDHPLDLSNILSEKVVIGFSAATGDYVETHDILSWSFSASL